MATQLQVAAGLYYSLTYDSSSEYSCALYIYYVILCSVVPTFKMMSVTVVVLLS